MDIQKFAQWIQKNNKDDRSKMVLSFIAFLGLDFCMTLLSGSKGAIFSLLARQCIVVAAALEVGRYQWNRYLHIYENEIVLGAKKSLSEVTRMQAFPVKEYFAYVNKKMVLPGVLLGVCSVSIGILGAMGEERNSFD